MSFSAFFGSLAAQFIQDLLFRRPVNIEVKRDANGMQVRASISPSGSQPQQQPQFAYPPPFYPWHPLGYGYPATPRPEGQPQPQNVPPQEHLPVHQPDSRNPETGRAARQRPFIIPTEHSR